MKVADAAKDLASLVDKVYLEGISVDLERDAVVIARLTPAPVRSPLKINELNGYLRRLPSWGEDCDAFASDVRAIRAEFPMEANPWE